FHEGKPGSIPKTEGFLKKALGQGLKTAGSTLGQMIPGQDVPFHPFETATGEARQMKERGIEGLTSGIKNPLLKFGASVAIDPETYIGGGGAVAEKVPQQATGAMKGLTKSMKGAELPSVSLFRNPLKGHKIAQEALKATEDVFNKFDAEYDDILKNVPDKPLPRNITDNIQNKALEVAQTLPEGSPGYREVLKFGEEAAKMTGQQLHAAKQKLFKISRRMTGADKQGIREVYQASSESLGSPEVFGTPYKTVSSKYGSFLNDEFKYVEDNIIDKFGKPTEEYLTQKTPLSINEETAFKKLGDRASNPFVRKIKGIKRGEKYKKAIPFAGRFL
ncbi:MAG: hypothetical protein AAB801_00930, partial [Patescibacteria group bacterium]